MVEVGSAVRRIKKGDRVCLPFNVSCGYCRNCERGFTGFCLSMNPPNAGAAYGYAGMGPYPGGQAEFLKVPYADFNCLRLPDDAEEKEAVVYGCGPVGLMAAYSAVIKGAAQVMIVDRHPDRLQLAESIGVIAIDDSKGDPVERVLELTGGRGADRGCAFDVATYFEKGLQVGSGQRDVKRYNRRLRELIHTGDAVPSFIVSHELPLDQAPDAYRHFDARENGWTKVILHPGQTTVRKAREHRRGRKQTRRRPSRPSHAIAE